MVSEGDTTIVNGGRRHRRLRWHVMTVLVLALAAAGCGDDDDDEAAGTTAATATTSVATSAPTQSTGATATTVRSSAPPTTINGGGATLKVTTLGLCNEIPVFWSQAKGIFEKNNIKVELVRSTGGAAAIAALQSGAIDLAFTNPFSTMLAVNSGINLKWIATAYGTPTDYAGSTSAIAVKADGPIATAKDLEGKTVGVNEIGGINQIITSEWIKMKGGDPAKVKFVALPFNQLAPSVAGGQVDAAQTLTQLVSPQQNLKSIADPFIEVGNGKSLIFAGYVTTDSKLRSSEAAMKAYYASLVEADEALANPANKDEKFRIESVNCNQPAESLAKQPENPYVAKVSIETMDRMGQILVGQGRAPSVPKATDITPEWNRA